MKEIKSNEENLMFHHLGNGISVCDSTRMENRDYMIVAHISYDRTITYYNSVSSEGKERIEHFARYENMNMSATQPYPVLKEQ